MPDIALESVTPTAAAATDNIVVRRGAGPADHTIALVSLASVGPTNLTWTAATSTVTSDTGTDATLTAADGTNPGLMTSANFTKLAAISGANTGDQTITLTGDVTGSGTGSFAATIAAAAVTLAKMANVATGSVFYRKTAGAGAPEVQTLATLKTDLGLTGTNSGDQTITLTGDVTGTGTGSFAATVAANAVTNAKRAQLATARIRGRVTAGTGDTEDLTGTQATTLLDTFTGALKGLVPASGGGTANFLRADGTFAAPAGGGDMVLASAQTNSALKTFLDGTFGLRNIANTFTALFANTNTAARTYTLKDASGTLAFTSDITGTNSGVNTGDQTITLTADVTGSGTGSFAATIAADAVTNAKMANMATSTIKGRVTAATGDPEDLTGTQVTALLDLASTTLKGLAPVRSGVATEYLNGTGTYSTPAGGGGVTDGDKVDITVSGGGTIWTVDPLNINLQTGTTYTPVLADAKASIEMTNAAAKTLTLPLNSAVAYPTGIFLIVRNSSATAITVSFASGITVQGAAGNVAGPGSFSIPAWQTCTLQDNGTDTWIAVVTTATASAGFDFGTNAAMAGLLVY